MSGILLPGQDDRPKPQSSGIEIAKGFSTKRDDPPKQDSTPLPPSESTIESTTGPDQTADTSTAEQPPPSQDASAQADQRPQIDFAFPPRGAQIQCPNCGTAYVTPVFSIIDLGENPELKGPLLGGQVNIAVCSSCGAGGPLNVPLLVHEPAHEFLGVYAPAGPQADDVQRQKAIGDLTQTLMRGLPTEARKGYLLQPQQFFDWQRLLEKLWGFEGVTPEMLQRQRDQSVLMQNLLNVVDDDTALKMTLERHPELVDRAFFAMLEQASAGSSSQGQNEVVQKLITLRQKLLDLTDAGEQLKQQEDKVRDILSKLGPDTTREQLLDLILETWHEEDGQEMVAALSMAAAPLLDYQFLMLLAQKIEQAEGEAEESLNELRELILEVQERQKEVQQAAMQQVQGLLQQVLQSDDTMAALRQYADAIDENFLGVLAANIRAAQQQNATAAVQRLQQVYQQAITVFEEKMPPEIRLLNRLASAPDEGSLRTLLQENRHMLNKEFVETLTALEQQMRSGGQTEQADRLKSLRGRIALMI